MPSAGRAGPGQADASLRTADPKREKRCGKIKKEHGMKQNNILTQQQTQARRRWMPPLAALSMQCLILILLILLTAVSARAVSPEEQRVGPLGMPAVVQIRSAKHFLGTGSIIG